MSSGEWFVSTVKLRIWQRNTLLTQVSGFRIAEISCILGVIVLLTVNLTTWPVTWYDEGVYTAAAATLARTGVYGITYDGHHLVLLDPEVTIGPTIIGPLAFVFKLFGMGMLQARLPMVLFTILTVLSFYLLARRLGGAAAGISGTLFLVAGTGDPYTSLIPLGRQVMGEVPALGLLCAGCWYWLRETTKAPQISRIVVTGGCFGLSMITKPQVIPMVLVILVVISLGSVTYYRSVQWWVALSTSVVAFLCGILWYGLQTAVSGSSHATVSGTFFADHIAIFSAIGSRSAVETIWGTAFILWGLPGIAYGLHLARQRTAHGLLHAGLVAAIIASLIWFFFLSVGWSRYAGLPLMLTTLYSGRLYADLLAGKIQSPPGLVTRHAAPIVVIAFPLVFLFFASTLISPIFGPQDTSAQDIAAFMRREVPAESRVESWAWEIQFLTSQRYQHPNGRVLALYIAAIWRGQPVPPQSHNPAAGSRDYLLAGPFSAWTGIYSDFISAHGEIVAQFGDYILYRIR
jgi:4-amino-4-deoxy-L-arabinose transferase-like glycosyltransferase